MEIADYVMKTAVLLFLLLSAEAQFPQLPYKSPNRTCIDSIKHYYNKNLALCCSQCAPGFQLETYCNAQTDTVCHPCPTSKYSERWSIRSCTLCAGLCKGDQIEKKTCSPSSRQICECKAGMFCTSLSVNYCNQCTRHQLCPPGHTVLKPGSDSTDTECGPCPSGTFSNVSSNTAQCQPHTNCSLLHKKLVRAGTPSRDTLCGRAIAALTFSPTPSIQKPRSTLRTSPSTFHPHPVTTNIVSSTEPPSNTHQMMLLALGFTLSFALIFLLVALLLRHRQHCLKHLLSNKYTVRGSIEAPMMELIPPPASGSDQGECREHYPQQESRKSPVEEVGKVFRSPVPVTEY